MGRPSAERLEVWQRWLRAQKILVERLDRELRDESDMTLEDYDVLVQLAQQPGGRARMSDLADALLIARSSCTRIVGRLEELDWVRRDPDAGDRRVVWATLTAVGASSAAATKPRKPRFKGIASRWACDRNARPCATLAITAAECCPTRGSALNDAASAPPEAASSATDATRERSSSAEFPRTSSKLLNQSVRML